MNGYQLTKAFYNELVANEEMQLNAKSHHLSLYTWICELRNRVSMEVVDLPRDYTMKMAFIGSPSTLKACIADLAEWGIIEIMKSGRNNWTGSTKVKLSGSFLNRHCTATDQQPLSSGSEMNSNCTATVQQLYTTKTNKTDKTKNIYRGRKKISDESITADSQEQEPRTTAPLPDPPPIEPLPLDPPPEPTAPDTRVHLNGKGQMIIPDLPTLSAFILSQGGTQAMADDMLDFYTSKGWMIGKNPMKDWNATARRWIRQSNTKATPGTAPNQSNSAPRPKHQTNIR